MKTGADDRDELGSGDYPGSDEGAVQTSGIAGDQTGSPGYPRTGHGYPQDPGDSAPARASRGYLRTPVDPPWKLAGFGSVQEFLDHAENEERMRGGLPPLPTRNETLEMERRARAARASLTRQVGVKLDAADYAALTELAATDGIPATTMARILILRGLRESR